MTETAEELSALEVIRSLVNSIDWVRGEDAERGECVFCGDTVTVVDAAYGTLSRLLDELNEHDCPEQHERPG